ncbi:hypothetical protein [Marinobacter sp. CHS3-4]|uniref:hypothetical protein n=1 Tax=Marinobacter sp. CHS3-4 TaxID=3045174 RepID=UPI0024B4EB6F|nr:hypothetical protein [Marinobacter sp. CHS3-4]MDI9245375.1 hypothetical protein [Marinobacter sp. CHS3-4]
MITARLNRQQAIIDTGKRNNTFFESDVFTEMLGVKADDSEQFLNVRRDQNMVFCVSYDSRAFYPTFQLEGIDPGKFELLPEMPMLL